MKLTEALKGEKSRFYTGILSLLLYQPCTAKELQTIFNRKIPIAKEAELLSLGYKNKISVALNDMFNLGLLEKIDKEKIKGSKEHPYYTGRWLFNFNAIFQDYLAKEAQLRQLRPEDVIFLLRDVFLRPQVSGPEQAVQDLLTAPDKLATHISNLLKGSALLFNKLHELEFCHEIKRKESREEFVKYPKFNRTGFERLFSSQIARLKREAAEIKTNHNLKSLLAGLKEENFSDFDTIVYRERRLPYNFAVLLLFIKIVCAELDKEVGYLPWPQVDTANAIEVLQERNQSASKVLNDFLHEERKRFVKLEIAREKEEWEAEKRRLKVQ